MQCLKCKKETSNPKFCSRSCSASYANAKQPKRRKSPAVKCCIPDCNNPSRWGRNSRCEIHHQEYKQRKHIKGNTLIGVFRSKDSVSKNRSWINVHIRQFARIHFQELLSKPCASCGYSKHVELCHIKPVSSFPDTATVFEVNSADNVIQLCPNCHWEFDHGGLEITAIKDL